MCGIAGVQTANGAAPDPALLDRMRVALAHRGPDGHATLIRADTGLLHLRLAIVDVAGGDQPLFGPDGVALIGNGEIYNDRSTRAGMTGTPFATGSDCEPPAFLYATDGPGFADRLRGMYAIAIHDLSRGRLLLTRDPFGIKPIYYVARPDLFAFASEPAALIAAGFATAAVDPSRANELLQLKFTTGRQTIFPAIERVLPGETLIVEHGRIIERRIRAALPAGVPRIPRTVENLDAALLDSVAAHLRSDVPYGLFLSGGIDSAAVLALMRRAGAGRVHALTAGWDGAGDRAGDGAGNGAGNGAGDVDETAEAARLARIAGADCTRVQMGEADFWALAPRIVACVDDPTADAAILPSWLLGRAARAGGLKVALCGEGADELFGGYARHRKQRAPFRWFARPPRSGGVFGAHIGEWRDGIANAEHAAAVAGRTPIQRAQAVDVAEWLPNDLLLKLDRTLMVHGVEGRTPFLDPVVAAFAYPLPDAQKTGARFGKLLLRRWLAGAFPEAGAWSRKRGFKPPVGRWIFGHADRIGALVAAEPGVAALMPPERVRAAFAAAERESQPAWSLLHYALWHSHYIRGVACDGSVIDVLS